MNAGRRRSGNVLPGPSSEDQALNQIASEVRSPFFFAFWVLRNIPSIQVIQDRVISACNPMLVVTVSARLCSEILKKRCSELLSCQSQFRSRLTASCYRQIDCKFHRKRLTLIYVLFTSRSFIG